MSKTVSELAQELGLSKQYLNRILSQNNLGRKSGNKKLVSDMPLTARETREENNIGNQKMETKSETEMETSFRYVREQLEIKGKIEMKKNFIAIIKNILKNKNILNIVLKLLKKDGSTCFLSTNYFDVINFEILNILDI